MWLTLAEQHVRRRKIQWKDVERVCFNEWASPDDDGLGDQIVKVIVNCSFLKGLFPSLFFLLNFPSNCKKSQRFNDISMKNTE